MLLIKNLREKDGREIMARQLKDYKRKEIRCLIVEDFETGRVFKVNKEEEFENIIAKYTKDEITKVYNPTAKQKAEIYEMMDIKNIVFVRGKMPSEEMIELAEEYSMVLMSTKDTLYTASGKLYSAGLVPKDV